MDGLNKCNICKIRAYIECDQCDSPVFFCSRGHLHSHKIKVHNFHMTRSNSNSAFNTIKTRNQNEISFSNRSQIKEQQPDLRKLFEHLQSLKSEIEQQIQSKKFVEAILIINKCLPLAKKFYQEDHIFNVELLFKQAECYLQVANLEEAINTLEILVNVTQSSKKTNSISIIRYNANMLIGATCINIGDYTKAIKAYNISEQDILEAFSEPELNIKLASVYLNIGICYIYLNNPNIAEKYLKKGLMQSEGILGNDIINKLNADLNENLGIVQEQNQKPKEALNFYKKSLRVKFGLYGENHDEVLDLQYKISSVYISLKQFKQAEEIMTAMTDVILKEKLQNSNLNNFYRYGVYFYTCGMILLKNKNNLAKEHLNKAYTLWKDLLSPSDPTLASLNSLIHIS